MKILQNKVARAVYRLSFGPGGRTLVTGGSGGLDIWDLMTEGHTHIPCSTVTDYITVCECDPLGRWFYLAESFGGWMVPWTGQERKRLPGPLRHQHVDSLAVSADGARLLLSRGVGLHQLECWATAEEPFTPVWGWRNGKQADPLEDLPRHQLQGYDWGFKAVALARAGRLAAAVEIRKDVPGPFVALRDGGTGELLRELGPAGDFMSCRLTFTPDGKTLIGYGEKEKEITLWDTATGSQVGQLSTGRAKLHGLVVDPSGRFLMTAGADRTARTWDLASLRQTGALKWTVGKLSSVAISSDGGLAAAGGEKGQVVLWDID